jgi:FtsH-binding integral membrane protein
VDAITRWAVHFVLTVAGAFLFIILPAKLNSGSGNFMGIVFIIAIYFVGVLLTAVLSSRIKKTIKQDKDLKSRPKTSGK